jgi:hypothetical protein
VAISGGRVSGADARGHRPVFALSPNVREVAVRIGDTLELQQRAELANASSSESDRYEELLVNPTVLGLTCERGRLDCGGLAFVLIRYESFFQLVHPVAGGHVSKFRIPSHALKLSNRSGEFQRGVR